MPQLKLPPLSAPVSDLLDAATAVFRMTLAKGMPVALFASRYQAMLDARHDLCESATLPGDELLSPRRVRVRLAAMTTLTSDPAFVQTATRPANIVAAASAKGMSFSSEGIYINA